MRLLIEHSKVDCFLLSTLQMAQPWHISAALLAITGSSGVVFQNCPTPGRHKTNGSHYYPALLKPLDYTMAGCDHPDLSHFSTTTSRSHYFTNLRFLLASPNDTQYKKRRLETGIVGKPTIFLGLPTCSTLGIPRCFGSDIMHLGTFNLSDLLLPLWRSLFDHDRLDPPSNWPWAVLQAWRNLGITWCSCVSSHPIPSTWIV